MSANEMNFISGPIAKQSLKREHCETVCELSSPNVVSMTHSVMASEYDAMLHGNAIHLIH